MERQQQHDEEEHTMVSVMDMNGSDAQRQVTTTTPESTRSPPAHPRLVGRDSSQTSTAVTTKDNEETADNDDDQHHKFVKIARIVVIAVLCLSAITIASLQFVRLSRFERHEFELQFEGSANQVIHMAKKNAANVFSSIETIAALLPFYAYQTNETLPFVTLNNWEGIAKTIRNISRATTIGYSPLLQSASELKLWNAYSSTHTYWIQNGRSYIDTSDEALYLHTNEAGVLEEEIMPYVYKRQNNTPVEETGNGPFIPMWQVTPVPPTLYMVNLNLVSYPFYGNAAMCVLETNQPCWTSTMDAQKAYKLHAEGTLSFVVHPVYNGFINDPNRTITGFIWTLLAWKYFFDDILSEDSGSSLEMVIHSSCNSTNTFLINGTKTVYMGDGDLHNKKYDGSMVVSATFVVGEEQVLQTDDDDNGAVQPCHYHLYIYPTESMESQYTTNDPLYSALIVAGIFTFAAVVFLMYDASVRVRQNRTEFRAQKSSAIVAELFPGNVARQLYGPSTVGGSGAATTATSTTGRTGVGASSHQPPRRRLSLSSLAVADGSSELDRGTIADFYPESTVLFADIAGFTAWSSTRDPHQVFTLLESIFQAFDGIAKYHGVFKVETIGDCYVAVCGVPTLNDEHAVVMCNFARCAMLKFRNVCQDLELTLGPGTGDLALRVGMHSGCVTAGVLRGERARFQLFGDTVNTAARIESTGHRNRIQLSEQTAEYLTQYGKGNWIVRRDDPVHAKGKGELITYWLKMSSEDMMTDSTTTTASRRSSGGDWNSSSDENPDTTAVHRLEKLPPLTINLADTGSDPTERLTHWNSELLINLLQQVVSRRQSLLRSSSSSEQQHRSADELFTLAQSLGHGMMPVDEVVDIIDLPDFERVVAKDDEGIDLDELVVGQLRGYVNHIASLYRTNSFHNFEHASHVTMSANKLLNRIIAPQFVNDDSSEDSQEAKTLHDSTYGITSDPMTQFAVILSALIHDVDHAGVPNGQLIKENEDLAGRYSNRSVAEQNSIDCAWNTLLLPEFEQLRGAIFTSETELYRFRHLLVNLVVATDIFDKDLSASRKERWDKAFAESGTTTCDSREDTNRKATIVLEHLIQASDVAHTMQHWHVYKKWNQRLFNEAMTAFRSGKSDKDPADGWYNGELWFFDNYVIPLAKKLKVCGVFGVSGDEYLNYAVQNRKEWECKGIDVVREYVGAFNDEDKSRELI